MLSKKVLEQAIINRVGRLKTGSRSKINIGEKRYYILIYRTTKKDIKDYYIISIVYRDASKANKQENAIGYYVSDTLEESFDIAYPKSNYKLYTYEDLKQYLYEDVFSGSGSEPGNEENNKVIEKKNNKELVELERQLNILELKIKKEELLLEIERLKNES